MRNQPDNPILLTRAEVADILSCSNSTVIRYGKIGLHSHRMGPRLIRYYKDDVFGFMNRRDKPDEDSDDETDEVN